MNAPGSSRATTPRDAATDAALVLLAAASGWLCAKAYPAAAVSSLAFVALVPFLLALRLWRPRSGRWLAGAAWMLLFAWGINDWFPGAVARYYGRSWSFGFAFFLAVTLLSAAPATMLFAEVYGRLGRRATGWGPLVGGAAWTAGEWFRTQVLGDPWGLLGYSQAPDPRWLQVADVAGVYGVGFVVVVVDALLAEAALAAGLPVHRRTVVVRGLAAAALLPFAALAYGHWRIGSSPGAPIGATRDVIVVQGNVDFRRHWDPPSREANLQVYLDRTREALVGRSAALVLWPENAVTSFLEDDSASLHAIAEVLQPSGATLVAGAPRLANPATAEYRNAAVAVSADGVPLAHYDKQRLLPFGEYQPVSSLDFATGRFEQVREFAAGPPEAALLDSAGLRLGVVICNEVLFADAARDRAKRGAEVLVALTNDTWVGDPKFAAQAFDKAVVRAVEQRRPLVRASTSGPSAIVDPVGRVVARTRYGEAATLLGRLPLDPASGLSPYARAGDVFAWCCVAATLAAWAFGRPAREKPS